MIRSNFQEAFLYYNPGWGLEFLKGKITSITTVKMIKIIWPMKKTSPYTYIYIYNIYIFVFEF